jgi:Fe-S oxidoreductase
MGAIPEEGCCGGRAYQMGYLEEAAKQARRNMDKLQKSGVKTLVTGCAECYFAYKVLYSRLGVKGDLEVVHITEYLAQLIRDGRLKPTRDINLRVTYHDPCHLGRLGEAYIPWQGQQRQKHVRVFDPPRTFRRGTCGVYEPPREVLKSIPGIQMMEMDRTKEYAWCCGAGGGVKESNPDFAQWTAKERIKEAEATGAEVLVTACPHCESNFNEAIKVSGSILKVWDIVNLFDKAIT